MRIRRRRPGQGTTHWTRLQFDEVCETCYRPVPLNQVQFLWDRTWYCSARCRAWGESETVTPDDEIETEDDTKVIFKLWSLAQVQMVNHMIVAVHPDLFRNQTTPRPLPIFNDGAGNAWNLHICPDCGGRYAWCMRGPDRDQVRVSARLLDHAKRAVE